MKCYATLQGSAMGTLVKQTVNSVVFMDNLSSADDIRCITLEIGCEGAGRFLVLKTEKANSEVFFSSPDDLLLVYKTAVQMWEQGDIYAPGDTDGDPTGDKLPTLTGMLPKMALTPANINRLADHRDFLMREMRRIEDDPGNSCHIASEAISAICAEEVDAH